MSSIQRLRSTNPNFAATLRKLLAFDASQDDAIEHATADILKAIGHRGDDAVLEYTRRFDRVQASSVPELEIPRSEWLAAL